MYALCSSYNKTTCQSTAIHIYKFKQNKYIYKPLTPPEIHLWCSIQDIHDKLAAYVELVCTECMQLLQADCASIHTCSGKGKQVGIGCKEEVVFKGTRWK